MIKGEIIHNREGMFIENLDKLPFPAYDLLPMDRYRLRNIPPRGEINHRFALMSTTRGCPYGCSFCNLSMYGTNYRKQSIERIFEEIDLLVNEYRINWIFFHDLTFIVDKRRTEDFCRLLLEKKYDLSWACQTRPQNADRGLLTLMKKSGCCFVEVGIETGDEVQHGEQKNIPLSSTEEFIRNCRAIGLGISPGHLLGLPGTDENTVRKSVSFLKKEGLPFRLTHTAIPYPGTDLYELGRREGKIKADNWESVRKAAGKIGNRFSDKDLARLFQKVNASYRRYILFKGLPRLIFRKEGYLFFISLLRNVLKEDRSIRRVIVNVLGRTLSELEWLLYKI